MTSLLKDYKNKLIKTVGATIKAYRMIEPGDSVLVGVSGGPDSVALLHIILSLAQQFSIRVGVAHLNHSLRQKDSDDDAEFVASFARNFDLPCYIKKEDVSKYRHEKKLSLEEAARIVRYRFFESVAEKYMFNKIALGHNADDNAELVIMQLLRGSGPLGISGIPPVRNGKIIRPLIKLTKSEILEFLAVNELKFVLDKSNNDQRYLRNRIRHHLIPHLKSSYNKRIVETINRFASIIRSEEEWIDDLIKPIFNKSVLAAENNSVALSISSINELHIAAQRRIIRKAIAEIKGNLRRITFSHIESVISLLNSGHAFGCIDLPDRIWIKRDGDTISFSREKSLLRDLYKKLSDENKLSFEYRILKPEAGFKAEIFPRSLLIKELGLNMEFSKIDIKNLPDIHHAGHNVAFFDMDKLSFPLVLRNFRPGDKFQPLGMSGTQKVKKYFINNKVARVQRAKCLILLSQDKIMWVVGYRIDDFFKVKQSARNILKVELFLA
ncbi:MAG: tRNA lysidine(34) synthetase TilS [Proteobacteria bacterium]|nr:tRNA lysidine(34) synthetase TilS [Desulfobacteraceae bacterium]MBU3979743.1 tRNA lysidine(34) synthetase TilS [Pseudomonadota bacterium]MBU4012868.1 tRNA lysidine(34) synthetase TilS [Pseudomonadota bacterium]MBU4068670.1 tRNA lysidine(34) synthetase TilS [Pseudomonadota bacterium]MBU4100387.1 tRNA lysidine(34) synthetase TilS [Pseudomonadota bacterium]